MLRLAPGDSVKLVASTLRALWPVRLMLTACADVLVTSTVPIDCGHGSVPILCTNASVVGATSIRFPLQVSTDASLAVGSALEVAVITAIPSARQFATPVELTLAIKVLLDV